jgi:hypothetical protein
MTSNTPRSGARPIAMVMDGLSNKRLYKIMD